jgi:hypothetical protein
VRIHQLRDEIRGPSIGTTTTTSCHAADSAEVGNGCQGTAHAAGIGR